MKEAKRRMMINIGRIRDDEKEKLLIFNIGNGMYSNILCYVILIGSIS